MSLKGLKHTAASIKAAYDCTADATVFHFIEDALAEVERLEAELGKAERVLQLFTERYPPPEKGAHIFKLRQDGQEGLELVLNLDGKFYSFGFEREDFEKTAEAIVEEISLMFRSILTPEVIAKIHKSGTQNWKVR